MAANAHYTYAQVVACENASPATVSHMSQEFAWKEVKKGRLRPSAFTTPAHCTLDHCQDLQGSCRRQQCIARIDQQLLKTSTDAATFATTFQGHLLELDNLRQDIHEHCRTDSFFSADMEVSRIAFMKARRVKQEPVFCDCPSCQLAFYKKECDLLNNKLSAAENRLKILRDFRRANDTGAIVRTSTSWVDGGKYFTPVGRAKANGVSALRPALQMQTSYDFAALTTNSMKTRPLKGPSRKKKGQSEVGN